LKYSQINGVSKFGFSVQKEIIKKCGYKMDGSNPPSEIWYDFLDEVGWRDKTKAKWHDPTYTLDINTRIGVLPCWRIESLDYKIRLLVSSLASRLVNCSR
jgi:hypothetical protein